MKSVLVRIPATSANLGPGFDSLGVALSVYNTMGFTLSDKLSFSGCAPIYRNERNLAYRAFRDSFLYAGRECPAVHIDFKTTEIPVSRGLGSSAALLVGGAVAANALMGNPLSRAELLAVTNKIEGHPDNLSPAIFGGLTASMMENGVPYTAVCPISDKIGFYVFIPDFETSTHAARRVLPKTVPHKDAVYNLSHAAVLLRALETGDEALLTASLSDKLHVPYRKHLFPEYDAVEAAARNAGAAAFTISGSGSTLIAVTVGRTMDTARLEAALAALTHKWRCLPLKVDREGAAIIG